jgi:hypothetical protein
MATTHSFTHSVTNIITLCSFTSPLPHSPTRSLAHSLTIPPYPLTHTIMSTTAELTASLFDISESLTTNILAEDSATHSATATATATASRELLNSKRKSRDDDEQQQGHQEQDYIPLVRAPRKRLKAAASFGSSTATLASSSSVSDSFSLISSIAQGGAAFSVNDTSFHNASKNKKVVSKAQKKKNAKGSNYADKMSAKMSVKQKSRKQKLKAK